MGSIFVPELGFIWEDEMSPAHRTARTPARNNNPSAGDILAQVTRRVSSQHLSVWSHYSPVCSHLVLSCRLRLSDAM